MSDQRGAASVGDSRVRERHVARDPSFRMPHTNSLTPSPTRPATRDPALRAARNFSTDSGYPPLLPPSGVAGAGASVSGRG
ncbi:MAG: hypothetical protein WCG85_28500, partial [Polyangia bacterium]